jgi:hypothetical protein
MDNKTACIRANCPIRHEGLGEGREPFGPKGLLTWQGESGRRVYLFLINDTKRRHKRHGPTVSHLISKLMVLSYVRTNCLSQTSAAG